MRFAALGKKTKNCCIYESKILSKKTVRLYATNASRLLMVVGARVMNLLDNLQTTVQTVAT